MPKGPTLDQREVPPPGEAREPTEESASGSQVPEAHGGRGEELDTRFSGLFKRHYDHTVVFFGRMGFARQDARDLAQETFARVYQGMPESPIANERAFIATVARRVGLNEIRRKHTEMRGRGEVSLEALPSPADVAVKNLWSGRAPASQEVELIEREEESHRRRRLRSAIDRLPPSLGRPLLLKLGGASYGDIQAALHLTRNAVKSRLRDARQKLRHWLGEEPVGIDGAVNPAEESRDRES